MCGVGGASLEVGSFKGGSFKGPEVTAATASVASCCDSHCEQGRTTSSSRCGQPPQVPVQHNWACARAVVQHRPCSKRFSQPHERLSCAVRTAHCGNDEVARCRPLEQNSHRAGQHFGPSSAL